MIWLKVLLALIVALLAAALMCLLVRRARARKAPPVLVPSDGSHDALDEDPERDATFEELVADLEVDR